MFPLAVIAMGLLSVGMGATATTQDRPEGAREASADARSICEDSRFLARLARITESPDADMTRLQSDVWCAARETRASLTWPNKRNARLPSGAWNYPSGRAAKTSGGLWHYPNGGAARQSSGLMSYPSGKTARLASGRWMMPDGRSATESELLLWACQKLGDSCRRQLAEIGALAGFAKDLAIVELVWSAR
jgi:hypothetical protein